jgi:hypothetical protein
LPAGIVRALQANVLGSLRAAFRRDVERALARTSPATTLNVSDITHLPDPIQRYLRITGSVGQPRVRNFHARMHGRFRGGRESAWMPIAAEQYNFVDPPARFFFLTASMRGIPVHGFHRYADGAASMDVRAAWLVPVARASGPEATRSETVTMFNDMCLIAPAMLVEPSVEWEGGDAHSVRARFTNAGFTIRAELTFDVAGELTNFQSDDRSQTSDGRTSKRLRWSTPCGAYRSFGPLYLTSGGAALWHEPDPWPYIELVFDDIRHNERLP